jgi:uncharacterized RDD family membrane protein YckC
MENQNNPYAPPTAHVSDAVQFDEGDLEYGGFWRRAVAYLIDSILLSIIIVPLTVAIVGWSYFVDGAGSPLNGMATMLLYYGLPAAVTILFWKSKQATPGKMAMSLKIIDADTGMPPTTGQSIGRYFAYYLSALVLLLGFFWVAFDAHKQGWHDKLARTLVVRT